MISMADDSKSSRKPDSPALQGADAGTSAADVMRSMPHALGPEKSILSSMLKDPEQWIGMALEEGLTRDHFYLPGHGLLFETLRELNAKSQEIELVSLVQLLHDRGLLDSVGGPAAITDIFGYAPNAAHFQNHLGLVKDKFVLRSIIRTCTEAVSEAYDNPEETVSLLDRVESSVLGIRQGTETTRGFHIKQSVS